MWLRGHLSYANVTATLALFVALGGTSYALSRIGTNDVVDNSLRSRDIRNDTLRSKDVRNQTLRGRDVRQNALGEREISESSLAKVPAAVTAELLGGRTAQDLRVRCPAGTRPASGTCVEMTARPPVSFWEAVSTCRRADRGLPTVIQLDEISRHDGFSTSSEWTSDTLLEPPETDPTFERLEALVVGAGGTVDHARVNAPNPHPFRCVALPSN